MKQEPPNREVRESPGFIRGEKVNLSCHVKALRHNEIRSPVAQLYGTGRNRPNSTAKLRG